MKTVAVVANIKKDNARSACAELISFFKERGIDVIADSDTAAFVGDTGIGRDEKRLRTDADIMVAVGGDGTVLKAARILAGARMPLLGINLGGLGFLTAATVGDAKELLEGAIDGHYTVSPRLLIDVAVVRGGKEIVRHVALNDAVISRGVLPRLVALEAFIDEDYLTTFVSDGLIVSTPTGSTAYSLSAGGPLVSPEADAIIITPICPHTLSNRPLVIPSRKCIRVAVSTKASDTTLTLDGQVSERLCDGDEVVARECPRRLMLVAAYGKSYFHLLREKMRWGERPIHG